MRMVVLVVESLMQASDLSKAYILVNSILGPEYGVRSTDFA